ncbi:MAG: acetyl-CoA carboxylase biotin carboxyl carrier protein [Gammaproteobacteria bacterium]|nr:acetyl-CoA carboxylase biotin carboxyl carrier protein [Gammaproteobacteria bacterium]
MDLRKVKKLIELLEASELVEMEITEGDSAIRLSRVSTSQPILPPQPGVETYPGPREPLAVAEAGGSEATPPGTAGRVITSPMVGTYYEAPSEETAPYVRVDAKVSAGDPLCLIEAMKTFNQVESDVSGTVMVVYKSNGDPVEFGEPLFLIQ